MRPRWKQAALTVLTALAVACAVMAGVALLNLYPEYLMIYPGEVEGQVDAAIISLAAYLAAVRLIEWRVPTEFSLRHAPQVFALGVIAGIGMFSLVMGVLWVVGAYQPDGWGRFDDLGRGLLFMLAVAVREEVWYRAVAFRLISTIVGTWGALLLSAVIFIAMHIGPTASPVGLLTVGLAGVMFGAAYAVTGKLWLPIGLHLGWNFAEGWLFGTAVSGHNIGSSLIDGTLDGPPILTGGNFGPEASIVALVVVLAVAAYLVWRIAKLRRAEPPIWRGVPAVAASAP